MSNLQLVCNDTKSITPLLSSLCYNHTISRCENMELSFLTDAIEQNEI